MKTVVTCIISGFRI